MSAVHDGHTAVSHSRDRWWWALLPIAWFIALVWPFLFHPSATMARRNAQGHHPTAQMSDQVLWHEPSIEAFAGDFPLVNFRENRSATAPGYHFVMSGFAQIDDGRIFLQFINSLFGVLLIVVVVRFAATVGGVRSAAFAALPLAASTYVVGASIWMNTDNLALLLVAMTLGLVVLKPISTSRTLFASITCAGAVFVRQIHIWAMAPVWLQVSVLGGWLPRSIRSWLELKEADQPDRRSVLKSVIIAAVSLLPMVVLGGLVWLWGGLTPPIEAITEQHAQGANPATFAFALAVVGGFGVFFLPVICGSWRAAWTVRTSQLVWVVVGALTAIVVPSSFDPEAGRQNGAIWIIVEKLHVLSVADRSLVLASAAGLGGLVLGKIWEHATRVGRRGTITILMFTALGWALAQSMNTQAWQRYFEPPVLMFLVYGTALAQPVRSHAHAPGDSTGIRWAMVWPLCALGLIQVALNTVRLYVPLFTWSMD